jgi:hypothetical protein
MQPASRFKPFAGLLRPSLLLASALLLTACASKAEKDFITACKSTGVSGSECSCAYKKLEKYYSPEVMDKLARTSFNDTASAPDDFPRILRVAVLQCVSD